MLRRFHPVLLALLLIGAGASVVSLAKRWSAEGRSRAVALVLDYGQFRSVVSATGVPLSEAYRRFKASGIRGMAITEETLGDLQANGMLQVTVSAGERGREYRLDVGDPAVAERTAEYVSRLARGATEERPSGDHVRLAGPGGGAIYIPGRFEDLKLTPTGLDAAVVQQVRSAGLEPVGRINNPLGLTAESMRWELERVKRMGVTTLIFTGEEVLGFRGLVKETAQAFRDLGLIYGSVELGKQRGDELMSQLLEDRLLRVHSIAGPEMPRLTPGEAIERYVRAASERNIRLNYVRLPGTPGENTFRESLDYTTALAQGIAHAKFGLAWPIPFGRVWPEGIAGRVPAAVIALGVGAGLMLLIGCMFPIRLDRQYQIGVPLALLCALLAISGSNKALQIVAFLSSVVFPTLGFVMFPQPVGAFEERRHWLVRERTEAVAPAIAQFAMISFVTLIGAFMIGGMLGELPYMVKVESFAGIKASTVLPLLLVGLVYLGGMSNQYRSWADEREAIETRIREFFSEPLRIWQIVALLVGLTAVALLVARSGNDPGVGVSDMELRFRALLDRFLGARPRTKEFLVGHPALLLSLAMATLPRWRGWAFPLLLVGTIGQSGMLNSFCHLHTPLKLSLLHTIHGLWMGGLIGLALIYAWNWLAGRSREVRR